MKSRGGKKKGGSKTRDRAMAEMERRYEVVGSRMILDTVGAEAPLGMGDLRNRGAGVPEGSSEGEGLTGFPIRGRSL